MKYEELENIAPTLLLNGDYPELAVLREQYSVATIRDREWLDSTVTVFFGTPAGVQLTDLRNFGFADVTFGLACGGEDKRQLILPVLTVDESSLLSRARQCGKLTDDQALPGLR